MVTRGTELDLQIEKLALEGESIARHEGFVYFVRNAVPGDRVRARVTKVKRNYAEAETIALLVPSEHRAEPRCKHFGTCGGCRWQHLAYDVQLREKQQYVADTFARIAGLKDVAVSPIIGSQDVYFYRNKMEFSFSRQRWLTLEELRQEKNPGNEIALGLHVPGRFDKVLDIEQCWLQSDLSNGILNTVREFCRGHGLSAYSTKTHEGYLRHLVIRQSARTGEIMVNLVTSTDDPRIMQEFSSALLKRFPQITTLVNNITMRKSLVAFGESEKVYHGPGYISERLGDYTFRISANSFFQTNTAQAERLYETARNMGELSTTDVVFDLYCGTGTIAVFISGAVRNVVGIDVVKTAIEDAQLNARLNNVRNCYFMLGDLKDKLTKDTSWLKEKPRVVILDPPRSGLHPRVVKEVALLSPSRIVYVSCNPATQARDTRMFHELGYEVVRLQPIDMFPHTSHIENVAALRRR